ncbi:nodulation protein NodU [Amycolatopsis sp. FBCC-B4732]|uniref:nodulation protein NodU n=1 Tax=Amycolatopsis sp. FBCC-B4732 TaxID=3079339 RepID=UPI001FF4AEA4|nr:nodulation protein NodU [Amycolatopsis sp. FBCC-B4732]UOX87627.1 nodulation protein NodU [Amycolatopsis sp. FBCC-B4732]
MIDGYYLSSYFDVGPLKNMLDVRLRHDHSVALWRLDAGQLSLQRYWEFERISGIKQHQLAIYDKAAFEKLIRDLLAEEGLNPNDVVEIWGTPGIETSRDYLAHFDQRYSFHGIAHVMTAIFLRGSTLWNEPTVVMSLDGGPDTLFESDARRRHYYPGCLIDGTGEMHLFDCASPGRLWSFAKTKFGLREGTLMALASASAAEIDFDLARFDGLDFRDMAARISVPQVLKLLIEHAEAAERRGDWLSLPDAGRLTMVEHRVSAVMKQVAELSLRIVRRNLHDVERNFGVDLSGFRLGLAGGFALNCPTNSSLINEFSFSGHQIPPCASDSGIALGVGLGAFFPGLKSGQITVELDSAYYGQGPGDVDEEIALVAPLVDSVSTLSPDEVVSLIEAEGVIAWVNGAAEIGPRALGNRSLLADPRSSEVKDRLNAIKKRQWWRPVAPIVLDSEGAKYFEEYRYSPFMLLNFAATEVAKREVPGVLHLDGTARVQSVSERANPALFTLLTRFARATGVPVLGNTSLNDAGEPIVNRLSEAIYFAAGKGISSLVVNASTVVRLRDARAGYRGPMKRAGRDYFTPPTGVDRDHLVRQNNPHELSRVELAHYYDNTEIFGGLNVRDAEHADEIRRNTAEYMARYPGAYDRG